MSRFFFYLGYESDMFSLLEKKKKKKKREFYLHSPPYCGQPNHIAGSIVHHYTADIMHIIIPIQNSALGQ